MNKHPRLPADDQTEDANPDDLPVINIDDDPDNANWLRILAKRREEEAAQRDKQQQRRPQQKPSK